MKLERFEIRFRPDRVEALRAMARRLAHEKQIECTWCDLVRRGIDLILDDHDLTQAMATPTTGVAK